MRKLSSGFFIAVLASSTSVAGAEVSSEFRFRVSLDDKEVGSQYFRLNEKDGTVRLETEADLAVKMLFVTAYRYLHRNVETWEDGCLTEIESSTRVNGKTLTVNGTRQDGYFEVRGSGVRLPECVMSFAYWDLRFLDQPQLLNTQSGEFVSITVSGPVSDERAVRGEIQPAQRYRLTAGDIDMQLWYSLDERWLALESKTPGGRTLRYELL